MERITRGGLSRNGTRLQASQSRISVDCQGAL